VTIKRLRHSANLVQIRHDKTCNNMTKTIISDHFHSGVGSTTPLLWY
jgi:hypothetical protein